MAEQTESSGGEPAAGPQLAVREEDAGRLDAASRGRLTAVMQAGANVTPDPVNDALVSSARTADAAGGAL